MKIPPLRLCFFLLVAVAQPGFAEEVACESVKHRKGGASSGHSAKLTLANGKIVGVALESFNASGREGGAYFCSMDTAERGTKLTWTRAGDVTKLAVDMMDEKSHISIKQAAGGYVLQLEAMSRYYCGAGAEWPASIAIAAGSKKCTVQ